jgi:pyruvate/2-oxoglutarate dehydrogenase complex dihydrolipoamide dehydrogenase (E3) component
MTEMLTPDVCVVGAGSAGLVVAAGAAQLGLDVVLIERAQMGGDCLNHGCVPSKALIAAADARHSA